MENDPEKYEVRTWTIPQSLQYQILLHCTFEKWEISISGALMEIPASIGQHLARAIEVAHRQEDAAYRKSWEFKLIRFRYRLQKHISRIMGK